MTSIDKVSDVIVQWAQALQRPVGGTRVNRKIQFGDRAVATAVREKLEALSDTECAFVVRSSTDDDAVKLRNEKPSTVGAGTGVIYLVFWLPGHRGHEKNYESLRDFPSVTLADFLSGTERFVLPGEAAIVGRCREAAAAWGPKDRDRAVEHLDAAWLAVRKCLREHRGGRDSSIPYIDDLPSYLAFLDAAYLPDEAWTRLAEKERPAVLVAAWGSALSRLSMFRLPALASALGVQMRPPEAIPSPSKTGEKRWVGALDEILAENKEVATDFSGLEEDVAGKQTLRERLDDLTRQVPLCENPSERPAAREALERFCQSGDVRAYDQVDWLFRRDPADRRSPSQGLRGLLIARKLRAARVNPLDKLAAETVELLERLAGDEAKDSGVVKDYVAVLRGDRAPDRHAALAAAEAFRCLASGTLSPGAASTPMITAFTRALDSPARDPGDLERLARTWEKYGRPDGDAPVAADGVLFGLTQLCLARLREEAAGDGSYRFAEPGEAPGTLVLSTQFDGERAKPLSIPVQDWSPQTRDRIFQWLRDEVRPLYFGEVEEGDEDEEDSEAAITIDVEWVRGSVPEPFGVMEIAIDRKAAPLIQRDGPESLTSFRREGEFPSGRALTELFRSKAVEKRAEDPRDEGLLRAWQTFTREIGYEPGAAAIGLLSPLPTAARGWVDAWVRAVSAATAGGNAHSEIETLERQIDQAEDILEVR
jgi:hypothetical protein